MKCNRHQPNASDIEGLRNLFAQGMLDSAEDLARTLSNSFPDHGFAWKVLGAILLEKKSYPAALEAANRAVLLLPDDAATHNNLGNVLVRMERFDAAEENFRKALAIAPNYAKALCNLAGILRFTRRLEESEACCRQALAIDPNYTNAHIALGNALELQNRITEAHPCYKTALRLSPDMAVIHSDLLHLLSLDVEIGPEYLFSEHVAFGEQFEAPLRASWPQHHNTKDPNRQLQIGFVTGDLYNHALANFLEPFFKFLVQKSALTTHIYYTRTTDDEVTQRLRAILPNWHSVAALGAAELSEKIQADGIDILIDLAGHTVLNRLLTFSRKPAPIQASWLGYLGTTGLQAMDYFVCDPFWIPQGEVDWQFTEKPAYLPAAIVFQPNPEAPSVNKLPAIASGQITFGSFNRQNKINSAVVALWSLLMHRVPTSRMVLGAIPPEYQDHLIQSFEQEGVVRSRLTFFPRSNQKEYLEFHHQVDFCLDTFPHGGGATTAHAAWMGVPTLCLAGVSPASRFGATEMHHLGLDGFIADSIDDFVNKGCYWAENITALGAIRQEMRNRFNASPLGQPKLFVDNFEALLRKMWQRWCNELSPAPLTIETTNLNAPSNRQMNVDPAPEQLENLRYLHQQERYVEAEALARQLIEDFPEHGLAWKILGSVLRGLGHLGSSLELQKKIVELRPVDHEAHFNLACEFHQHGHLDEAAKSYIQSLGLQPNNAIAFSNLGNILKLMGLSSDAEMYCRQAIAIQPDMANAHNNLGNALHGQGKYVQAQASYRQALLLEPNRAETYNNLAITLKDQGYWSDAKECFQKALEMKPEWAAAYSNLLYCMSHDVQTQPHVLHREHLAFGDRFEQPMVASWQTATNVKDPNRSLRIGFVSADFYDHALTNFLEPVFRSLAEKGGLELHAYYTHIYKDAATARMRPYFSQWNEVAQLSDEHLADQIRADGIDILIDLTGHTAHNRMLTFARKPAPIQASWLGYLGTTGLQAMDYYVCDKFWLPPGVLDWQLSEKAAYLPSSVAFQPSELAPPINDLPALRIGQITLGSFNRPNKINESVIVLWSMLLKQLPHARMVLGGIPPDTQETLLTWFANEGIELDRLDFHPRSNLVDYLSSHNQVDFCLDTFPYGGGATTANAAWMGVPTLSLAGETLPSRFGSAISHQLGLDGFIAVDIEEFIEKGRYWATHLEELASIRLGMRDRFLQSPFGKPAQLASHLETLLRTMWQRWCDNLPSATIEINVNADTSDCRPSPSQFGHQEAKAHLFAHKEHANTKDAANHNNYGVSLLLLERPDEAEKNFRDAIALAPNYGKAFVNLGALLRVQGRLEEAHAYCTQALKIDPCDASAHIALGNTLEAQGQLSQAQASYYRADMAHEPRRAVAHSNVLYLLNHDVQVEATHLFQEHLAFGDQFEKPLRSEWNRHTNDRSTDRCLKIGFVSGDFCHHALSDFLEPAFQALSVRPTLTLHAYSNNTHEDAVTERMRGHFTKWHSVANLTDAQLTERIRADGIDILIDLSGHTAKNRLLTFARKPAPIQASWLGYLGTTGLQAMDYYLCDSFWIPPGELDWQFTEKPAYLPAAMIFQPSDLAPAVNPLPALTNGYITFGSFNRPNKLNDSVIALWSILMRSLPTSRLLLGAFPPENQEALIQNFSLHAIERSRLKFLPRCHTAEYLASHHEVDFCLDTFPHGGGATTAHAAWMGVPTLSLAGETPASRFGPTEMHHLGLHGFIASSIEDFVEKGSDWARKISKLAEIRRGLRLRFSDSPLGQHERFASNFETCLRTMWRQWCRGMPPVVIE